MTQSYRFPRRTFLKGLGVTMALPRLEAMLSAKDAASTGKQASPVRMAYIFFPNGAIMPNWKPKGAGADWQLSHTLAPLAPHKPDVTVFTGLTQHHARDNGDGAGDHARNAGAFLTGAQPVKTAGADIRAGISADQAAVKLIGGRTKLPSLELGIDRGRNGGNCDSGYSCAYSTNISWKTPKTPTAKEINPKLAFQRLFGNADAKDVAARDAARKSILDMVAEDAAQLRKRLGRRDRGKLDEYLTSVHELEQRINRETQQQTKVPEYSVPEKMPKKLEIHIRLMYDIMALAFQADVTRICSFMLGNAGSNRSYRMVGVSGGHHALSHHRGDKKKMADITKIDIFLVTQFAYFLEKLKSIKEGGGTLLDNSLILYGSAIADGNRHTHHDLPIIVAGKGGGRFPQGRLLHYPKETPLNNLYLTLCHMAGAPVAKVGNSTGPLAV